MLLYFSCIVLIKSNIMRKHPSILKLRAIIFLLIVNFVNIAYAKPQHSDTSRVSLIMTGDALIHEAVYKDALINSGGYDFIRMLEPLDSLLKNYDLRFYNQESIIGGDELGFSSYPAFNTPSQFADAMISKGFNLVSLANNHSLDKGEKGILNSIRYWDAKPVLYSGMNNSLASRNRSKIGIANGISYVLLAYTDLTNGLNRPKGKEYLLDVYSDSLVLADIEKYREMVDVILVSVHFGDEYSHTPSSRQGDIVKLLINFGADIVIGHHPHVLQPVEWIENTLVMYSLGNFISGQIGENRRVGVMIGMEIVKIRNKQNDSCRIEKRVIETPLIYTSYNGKREDFCLYPFSQLTDSILPNFKIIEAKYKDIIKSDSLLNIIKYDYKQCTR